MRVSYYRYKTDHEGRAIGCALGGVILMAVLNVAMWAGIVWAVVWVLQRMGVL